MKADYKNWVPKGMIVGLFAGAAASLLLLLVFGVSGLLAPGIVKTALRVVFLIGTIIFLIMGFWMLMMNRRFSYNGKRQMSKRIIEGTTEYVHIPAGGTCLDVGCGSAALTIAVAKRNPDAEITGSDIWRGAYKAVFTKELCERNAMAEGVSNVCFVQGNALSLPFEDESFDAVCSNYVYHNIPSRDR